MTDARKLAHLRLAISGLSVALPLVGGWALRYLPVTGAVAATLFFAMLISGAAVFIYFNFRWRPKCPKCKSSRAKFSDEKQGEFLKCDACGFSEATGYVDN